MKNLPTPPNPPSPIYWCHFFQCRVHESLQWRRDERDSVSNHQPHDCLFNCLFRRRSKKNIKAPCHWPLCGEFTGDRWIPRTKASNAENFSIWWRHHDILTPPCLSNPIYWCHLSMKCAQWIYWTATWETIHFYSFTFSIAPITFIPNYTFMHIKGCG